MCLKNWKLYHKIYGFMTYDDEWEYYILCGSKKIREDMLDARLYIVYNTHFKSWCECRSLNPNVYDNWLNYRDVVCPGAGKFFYGESIIAKDDPDWEHVYTKKKYKEFLKNISNPESTIVFEIIRIKKKDLTSK